MNRRVGSSAPLPWSAAHDSLRAGFSAGHAGHQVRLARSPSSIPPRGFVQRLNPLPEGVEFLITAQTGLDVILFFTQDTHELVQRLPALSRAMALTGGIWVCWPSGEGIKTALSEDFIRQAALDIGLVDNKICIIDSTWTGLRLVRRPRGRLDKPENRQAASPPPRPSERAGCQKADIFHVSPLQVVSGVKTFCCFRALERSTRGGAFGVQVDS